MITTIPVTQLHRVIGKTLIIERMTGRWRAPLLYTITSVRWDPDHRMVAIGIGDDHPSPAPAGLSLFEVPADATVTIETLGAL